MWDREITVHTSAETEAAVSPETQAVTPPGEDNLYLIFTMDCLPARPRGAVSGPESWDTATGCMLEFASALSSRDLKATFFVVPEAGRQLQDPVEQVKERGMEAGLLCHPPIAGYRRWLGAYPYDPQREIVRLARKVWQQKLGMDVESFRPGCFSSNDYTFQIVLMEGFHQGSCSLPGRMSEEHSCSWGEADPLPRHTDPLDKNLRGTMEFYEVPVTSDFECAPDDDEADAEFTPAHLSLDDESVVDRAPALAQKHLARMDEEAPAVRTLTFYARNFPDYVDGETEYGRLLDRLMEGLRPVAEEYELEIQSGTVADAHRVADQASGSAGPAN